MLSAALSSIRSWVLPTRGPVPIGTWTTTGPLPFVHWVDTCPTTCGTGGGCGDIVSDSYAVPAFLACIRVLSETVASLPFRLIQHLPDGTKRVASDHWLYRLIHERPNPWQSSFEYREGMVADVATHGDHFSFKHYDPNTGRLLALFPLEPFRCNVEQLDDGTLVYDYLHPTGKPLRFGDDKILHVRGLSRDGVRGECPIAHIANPLALARQMETFSNRFWSNNARPGLLLEAAERMPPGAEEKLRDTFTAYHAGVSNAGRVGMLPHGVKAVELAGSSAEASQYIELRTFIVQEIARAMRVPCTLIGENSRATFSNSEQEQLSFVTNTIVPWCRRIEGAFQRSILDAFDGFQVELDVRGLLRGDSAARSSYYTARFALGSLSPNDIRRLEGEDAINDPAADEYYLPVNNLAPMSTIAAVVASTIAANNPEPTPATEVPDVAAAA